jgi:hypothetical protein
MSTRTHRRTVIFRHPFVLRGMERVLQPGSYSVIVDEELLEDLSFPVFRHLSTVMLVPDHFGAGASIEMIAIDPSALKEAMHRDGVAARPDPPPMPQPGKRM